jgi:hypothetical protein
MMIKLEDAGFKTDFTSIYWTYASGFPKAQNMAKAIDKRKSVKGKLKCVQKLGGTAATLKGKANRENWYDQGAGGTYTPELEIREPGSEEAKKMEGSYGGFQPKPAVEVIIVVQKTGNRRTHVDQALDNGKGVTWLDDCRIPYADENEHVLKYKYDTGEYASNPENAIFFGNQVTINKQGRFPANLLVSDDVLDDEKDHGHKGGYSRFFSLDAWAQKNLPFLIVPKASKKEKNAGLQNRKKQRTDDGRKKTLDSPFQRGKTLRYNHHPTVKPIKLMAYLVTMGSRPGDIVLDPFSGSGTTCIAAYLLGRKFLGIEIDEEYHNIAEARLTDIIKNTKPTAVPPMPLPLVNLEEVSLIKVKLKGSAFDMKKGELAELMDHIINTPVKKGSHKHGYYAITTVMDEDEEKATA